MQRPTLFFLLIFFIICSFEGTTTDKIQNDLQLTLEYKETKAQNGSGMLLMNVTNNSETEKHKIIRPGDGSENAWREPYLYFSAELKEYKKDDGDTLPYHTPLRCGNYSPDWQTDTIVIYPKQTVLIYQSFFQARSFFMIPSSGVLNMRAHYDYARGEHSRRGEDSLANDIKAIPAFTLTSNTIQIKVRKK